MRAARCARGRCALLDVGEFLPGRAVQRGCISNDGDGAVMPRRQQVESTTTRTSLQQRVRVSSVVRGSRRETNRSGGRVEVAGLQEEPGRHRDECQADVCLAHLTSGPNNVGRRAAMARDDGVQVVCICCRHDFHRRQLLSSTPRSKLLENRSDLLAAELRAWF